MDINIRDSRFDDVEKRISKMSQRANEFCQSRSKYQIEKFLVENEFTPITKYKLVAHNSFTCLQEVRRMIIQRERILREIDRKQSKLSKNYNVEFKDYDLDIFEKTIELENIEIRIKGLMQEVDFMEQICDKLEKENKKPFTIQQFEEEEHIYWEKRIATQMHESQISKQFMINEGDYRSYLQSIAEPILTENNKINPIPLDVNNIASCALSGRKRIEDILLKKIETKDKHE